MSRDPQRWPYAGQRVGVRLGDDETPLLAVVDDVRPPDQLHLREPVHRDGSPGPEAEPGTRVELGWAAPTGYHLLALELTGLPQRRVRLWRLQPVGEVAVLQRRAFVRVADVLPVELQHGQSRWPAALCDLSEGGARCVLPPQAPLAAGDHVQVAADVDGDRIRVDAVVVAVEPLDGERATARLRFAELRREGDVLRRRVMDVQRRARALGRL